MTDKEIIFEKLYLEAKNLPFSEIMSNGKSYLIPKFQRDYSWEDDQWSELWEDIEKMKENRIQHFMGYLVFQTTDGKAFEIIDGQQRLTTISIIILAAIAKFKSLIANKIEQEDNEKRVEIYRNSYIDVYDPISLNSKPKLILNRHNNLHFRALARELVLIQQRNIIKTNRNINKAFKFFEEKFSPHKTGKTIAEILSAIADGLLFTTITVKDELDAYTVFETLNARGLHLSTPDLLKNYLLSIIARGDYTEQDFDEFEEQWQVILEQLGETEFTNFLRSHTGMKKKLPNKKDLFYALKKDIKKPDRVFPYLSDLKDNAPVYAALQDHNDNFWNEYEGQYTTAREHLEVLKVFNIKTPLSLLMAGFQKLSSDNFINLLKYITVITIRYNVICGKPAKFQETIYNQMANKLINNENSFADLIKVLTPIYPTDEEFVSAFKRKTILSRHSSKKVFYLLKKIEQQLSNEEPPLSLTLEHVLPSSPNDEWQEYFGRNNYDDAINRLGNIALLSKKQNMQQQTFNEKRSMLAQSPYKINQHIAEYAEWNMDNLDEHQNWLARQAKGIWKISQF